MPALVYPTSDFQPFTKILSSEVNGKFNAIRTLLNTTGLDTTNVQVNGLARNRLTTDTAYTVVANDASGNMTTVPAVTFGAVYYDTNARVAAGALPTQAGGLGTTFTVATTDIGKVLQVNPAGTGLTLSTLLDPGSLIYRFYRFG
jgi:hypothetical protein